MDVDGEHLFVPLKCMGDIRRAQQLTGIELNKGVGLMESTFTTTHEQLVDAYRIAFTMETHAVGSGCINFLLHGLVV